jgi:hypothetical protein
MTAHVANFASAAAFSIASRSSLPVVFEDFEDDDVEP